MKNIRRQQKGIARARGRLFGWAMHSQERVDGFELRDVIAVTPETSLRLGAPRQAGAPVTVYEPCLANDLSLGLVLYAHMLPMPAGAVLANCLLMLERHVAAALPARPCTADVFAIWAADGLVAEGLLSDKPSRAPPLGSQRLDDTAVESPTSSQPPPDAAGQSPSDRSAEASTAH